MSRPIEASVPLLERGRAAAPVPVLEARDALAVVVGIVVGAGIFRAPSLVAEHSASAPWMLLAWVVGGLVSLAGALCYAELSAAYPHAGGDYHFLHRAFGPRLAFLYAWSRITVIQTGSVALLAFVFGDYMRQIVDLGEHSPGLYAAAVVAILTLLNVLGVEHGRWTQNLLTAAVVLGVILVAATGLTTLHPPLPAEPPAAARAAAPGLVMVFVLLTYGGWNEAAYLSADLVRPRHAMVRGLLGGIAVVTALYLLVNLAYLRGLGLEGMAASDAVAAELLRRVAGEPGARAISLLIALAALTSANATILTGGRGAYALGRDFPAFAFLGRWTLPANAPVQALLVQGAIALLLVAFGALARDGFQSMVEFTAPVFWLFFFLVGVALLVLRARDPAAPRPFRVPLYPLTPLLFCAAAAYLLYSSLAYTGRGALVGVAVLGCGALLLLRAGPGRAGAPY